MKTLLPFALVAFFAGCVSGDASTDLTKQTNVDFGPEGQLLASVVPNVDGSYDVSTNVSFDMSDKLHDIQKDLGTVQVSVNSNTLDIMGSGNFSDFQYLKLTLQTPSLPEDVLLEHSLTPDEQNGTHLSLPVSMTGDNLLAYLSSGSNTLTFYARVQLHGNTPTSFVNNMSLHVDVSVDKSL